VCSKSYGKENLKTSLKCGFNFVILAVLRRKRENFLIINCFLGRTYVYPYYMKLKTKGISNILIGIFIPLIH